jgi:hypothetical protein
MPLRRLVTSCTFVLALLASNHTAEASAILLTDRAAFELAAAPNLKPLRTTDIVLIAAGQFVATYGGILPVFMDIGGPAVLTSIGDVGVIPQGGAPVGSGFIGVGEFTTPITAVGYDVFGTFMLNGIAVTTTSPIFFGYIFDQPTTSLPLPGIFCCTPPSFQGGLPQLGFYFATNIAVQTTPEPSTALLFGSAFALLQGMRYRRRSQSQ